MIADDLLLKDVNDEAFHIHDHKLGKSSAKLFRELQGRHVCGK